MSFQFVGRGPVHHVEAEHLVCALRRFAAGPEGDEQAGDDGAVRLDFDAVLIVAEQVTATQGQRTLSPLSVKDVE